MQYRGREECGVSTIGQKHQDVDALSYKLKYTFIHWYLTNSEATEASINLIAHILQSVVCHN